MIITITGGSGSGKSALGESIAQKLEPNLKYYIATMEAFGDEAKKRIARHRLMREDKNFITVECPVKLADIPPSLLPAGQTTMLECMSNLVANEIFLETGCGLSEVLPAITKGLEHLQNTCKNLIIITNEIFADGLPYDQTTLDYIRVLGQINQQLAKISDVYIEAVYSLPIFHKGALPWQL